MNAPTTTDSPPWMKPQLRSAELELTTRCPCRCVTCGSFAGRAREGELSATEWEGVLDDLAEQGCRSLTFLGGEPLSFRKWDRLVRHARAHGMVVELVTSGVTVDADVAARAVACGLSSITVSVDGTKEVHDEQRRFPGGFGRALQAIRLLDEAGLRVGVTTQLNQLSVPTLEALAPRLQGAGALGWQVQLTFPVGRGQGCGIELQPGEMPALLERLRRLRKRHGLQPTLTDAVGYWCHDDTLLRTPPAGRARPWIQCFAGLRHVGIMSDGRVKGCLSLPDEFVEGSIKNEGLRGVWESPTAFAATRHFHPSQLHGPCADCSRGALCKGGCLASAVAFTGRPGRCDHCFSLFDRPASLGEGRAVAPTHLPLMKEPVHHDP